MVEWDGAPLPMDDREGELRRQGLTQATLDGHSFKMCDFRGTDLRGTHFSGCDLRNADFRWADLTDAEFGYVMTHDPNYGLTDVTGANWQGACLKRVKMNRVIGWFKD
jgi:uncharacterized protein YjbI with pentapeptide repeats